MFVPKLNSTSLEIFEIRTKQELASYLSDLVLHVPLTDEEIIVKQELVSEIHMELARI